MTRRHDVFEADGWQCRNCGSRKSLTIDHIIPLARGGTGARDNLQTLCKRCNNEKGCFYPDPEGQFPLIKVERKKRRKGWLAHAMPSRRPGERYIQCPRCLGTGVPRDLPVGRTECSSCRDTGRILVLRRGKRWIPAPLTQRDDR